MPCAPHGGGTSQADNVPSAARAMICWRSAATAIQSEYLLGCQGVPFQLPIIEGKFQTCEWLTLRPRRPSPPISPRA